MISFDGNLSAYNVNIFYDLPVCIYYSAYKYFTIFIF